MNEFEKYHFDLEGYVLVKNLLSEPEVNAYLHQVEELERHVVEHVDQEPLYYGHFGIRYHFDEALGYSSYKNEWGGGVQYIVDDFLNASSAFDSIVGHPRTMEYVSELAGGPFQLASSELRFRHKSNVTLTHMGGVIDARNRYDYVGRRIFDSATGERTHRDFDLLSVRVLYALHDIPLENGAFCAVPGSHKSNFFSPYGEDPTKEPGMRGIPMQAGDALFFTENLRHGGLPNLLEKPRKTIHLMIAPTWAGSQSPAHWNGSVYVSPQAWGRYNDTQRELFPSPLRSIPPHTSASSSNPATVRREDALRLEIEQLQEEVRGLNRTIAHLHRSTSWLITAPLRRAMEIGRRVKKR